MTRTSTEETFIKVVRSPCLQGWISGAELRFMLANMGDKMSYDEVDLLLDEAGIDGDGKFRCRQL